MEFWFKSDNRGKLQADYEGKKIFLCNDPRCSICDLTERGKLKESAGRKFKLEVELWVVRRPSIFWLGPTFYRGHLIKIVEKEAIRVDEGIESDPSYNTVIYKIGRETILVDPGSMTLNGDQKEFLKLLSGHRLSAVVLTHGHRDHWAFLRLLEGIDVPIYLTSFPCQLIKHTAELAARFEGDRTLLRVLRRAKVINPGSQINVGDTKIYTFPLVHSIPETMGLLFSGKKRGVHLGDCKLGEGVEKAKTITTLRAIAREEVDLLVVTTVNAHLAGYALPESVVLNALTDVMIGAEGRVIITLFSTNIKRIKGLVEIAQAQGRKICFLGTGMRRAQEELSREGELSLRDNGEVSDPRSMIFLSGNQAEENSILQRALKESKDPPPYQPENSDTVIFSSRGIPGNEGVIRDEIQGLLPKVKEIFLNEGETENLGLTENPQIQTIPAHSSGHESGGGIRWVVEDVLNPKRVLPIPQSGDGYEAFLKMINGRELVKERVVEL